MAVLENNYQANGRCVTHICIILHISPCPTDRLPQAMLAVYRSCGQQIINFQANLSGLFASKLA